MDTPREVHGGCLPRPASPPVVDLIMIKAVSDFELESMLSNHPRPRGADRLPEETECLGQGSPLSSLLSTLLMPAHGRHPCGGWGATTVRPPLPYRVRLCCKVASFFNECSHLPCPGKQSCSLLLWR